MTRDKVANRVHSFLYGSACTGYESRGVGIKYVTRLDPAVGPAMFSVHRRAALSTLPGLLGGRHYHLQHPLLSTTRDIPYHIAFLLFSSAATVVSNRGRETAPLLHFLPSYPFHFWSSYTIAKTLQSDSIFRDLVVSRLLNGCRSIDLSLGGECSLFAQMRLRAFLDSAELTFPRFAFDS